MSTGIGTLQAPRQSFWPALALALLVVMTLAIVATTTSATSGQPEGRFVGRHLVNAPSELSGGAAGFVGGTAANTPSELSGGVKRGPFGKVVGVGPTLGLSSSAEWPRTADAIAAAAAAERYDRHQRR